MSSCHTPPARPRAVLPTLAFALALSLGCAATGHAQPAAPTDPGVTLNSAAGGAASVQLWHSAARDAIARTKPNQQAALRQLTYLALAQHEAAQALQSTAPLPGEAAWSAAFDRASADLLSALVPALAPTWDALARSLAAARGDDDTNTQVAQAKAIAAEAARRVIARAAADGFDAAWNGTAPDTPAGWKSQLQPARPPHLPQLGSMKTIFLPSADALPFAAPPQTASLAFTQALDEVRQRATATNTAGLARAKRWEMVTGPLVAGYWDAVAAELARRDGLSGPEMARVLAFALGASMDGNIVCHRAKYTHWIPRPSQSDPSIKPLLGLPNHPSYPSNHSCDSMAAATVLGALFPRHKGLLDAMARDAGESRIDGGLHYRFDVEGGEAIGRGAAAAALRAAARNLAADQRP